MPARSPTPARSRASPRCSPRSIGATRRRTRASGLPGCDELHGGPEMAPKPPHVRHARTPTELAPGDEHAEVDDHDPEQQREAVEPTDSAEHGRRIAAGGERPAEPGHLGKI